jgi:glycosyltransferase involved in cell wall biosynthesis
MHGVTAPSTGSRSDVPPAPASAVARGLRVTIVAANTFEFDSRFLRTAQALAGDGHEVRILGWSGPGLAPTEELAPGVRLTRLPVDRRIATALRPLPERLRSGLVRLAGLAPDATVLPPDRPRGPDRLRHPVRRLLEIVANVRRAGPWTEAVLEAAPDTDVYHAQSLVCLPVVRAAARRSGGRFVYDVADYHTEAARLARMPAFVRSAVRRRERSWAREASAFLAVSDPVADLVSERWDVPRPSVLLNCPPAWRPHEPGAVLSDLIREATDIAPERPIILYQGGFSVDRGVEELLAAASDPVIERLDAAVVFMGYGRLEAMLLEAASRDRRRIHVLPAVPPDELLPWTASADVSFVGQPPRTLNQRMNLPNKLFESLMAGVPVIVSKGNEQCRLVSREQVGGCVDVDDPHAIAVGCAALLQAPEADRLALRAHCREVALERYTWEGNVQGLLDVYRRLAGAESPVVAPAAEVPA